MQGEPSFDLERWKAIQEFAEGRGKSQKGIPKVRDPAKYPLSCLVYDLTNGCDSVMYGRPHGKRLRYVCGRYTRTGGADCEHNGVDAEAMLRFSLRHLVGQLDRMGCHDKLRKKLLDRVFRENANPVDLASHRRAALEASAKQLEHELQAAGRNLAVEEDELLKQVVRSEYLRIKSELDAVRCELQGLSADRQVDRDLQPEQLVEAAMNLLDEIRDVAQNAEARSRIAPALCKLGFEVGLRFVDGIKGNARRVRRLVGGVVSVGGRLGKQIAERQNSSSSTRRDKGQLSSEFETHATKTLKSRPKRRKTPRNAVGKAFRSQRRIGTTGFEPATS